MDADKKIVDEINTQHMKEKERIELEKSKLDLEKEKYEIKKIKAEVRKTHYETIKAKREISKLEKEGTKDFLKYAIPLSGIGGYAAIIDLEQDIYKCTAVGVVVFILLLGFYFMFYLNKDFRTKCSKNRGYWKAIKDIGQRHLIYDKAKRSMFSICTVMLMFIIIICFFKLTDFFKPIWNG